LRGRKILILGASTWQVPYLLKAKELGLTVYATDWSNDAPGAKYADIFEPIDLKDKEATLSFAKQSKVEAVFTSADIGVTTAAFVAEQLGLFFHTNEVAFLATNKFAMRNKAKDAGLGIPKYELVDNIGDAITSAGKVGFPLIIKPVDNCSSRGVWYLRNLDELKHRFHESVDASFTRKVLLEECMTGSEGSIEAIIDNGEPIILGACDKIKSRLPYRYDLLLSYPGNYTKRQYDQIRAFTQKLVRGFEIKAGIVHIEFLIKQESVRLIEFAIRGCGSKVATHLMPAMTGFDVMEYLLYSAFGERKEVAIKRHLSGALKFIMLDRGTIKAVDGLDEIRKMEGIVDIDIERNAGDTIGEIKDGRSRPGYVLSVGKDRDAVTRNISEALSKLRISYQ
jgi:biotin carboxylase